MTYEFEQYPEDKTEKELEKHVAPAIRGHMKDFLAAIDKRSKPVADIEQGYISTASCILANVSMQLGRTLTWDAQHGRVVDDEEANRAAATAVSEAVDSSGRLKFSDLPPQPNAVKLLRDDLEVLPG